MYSCENNFENHLTVSSLEVSRSFASQSFHKANPLPSLLESEEEQMKTQQVETALHETLHPSILQTVGNDC